MSKHVTPPMPETSTLRSRIIKTKKIGWRSLQFLQDDNFKELPEDSRQRLKFSIKENEFSQPFYVWQDPDSHILYCLDGKHRVTILEDLVIEGYDVPEMLPATFVKCKDKYEASKLVLVYSSIYARITEEGMYRYITNQGLDILDLKRFIDIPDFSIDHYLQKFDQFNLVNTEPALVETSRVLVKDGDIFEINGHRIICGDSTDPLVHEDLMNGKTMSMVFTSPPYNMNAGLYSDYQDNLSAQEYLDLNIKIVSNLLKNLSGYLFYNLSYNRNSRSDFIDILHALKCLPQITFLELIIWNKKTAIPAVTNEMLTRTFEQVAVLSTDNMLADLEVFMLGSNKKKIYLNKRIGRSMTNYWEIPVSTGNVQFEDHGACFPIELPARAIQLTTMKGEIVGDPFFGMGTSMIAADDLGRLCYGIEKSPVYVQSSILRLAKHHEKSNKHTIFKHHNGSLTLKDLINGKSGPSEKNN